MNKKKEDQIAGISSTEKKSDHLHLKSIIGLIRLARSERRERRGRKNSVSSTSGVI